MIRYEEAVREGKQIAASMHRDNWRLGEIANQIETIYGNKTLERYADDIGLSYETVKYCRAVARGWPHHNRRPRTWSVAKALLKHPDKYYIIEKEPEISVKQAVLAVESWKERRSVGRYRDMVVHKLVKDLCQRFNSILIRGSKEYDLIKELARYNETDFEYIFKVINSISDLKARLDDAIKVINNPHHD
jgi:hypothetical protein